MHVATLLLVPLVAVTAPVPKETAEQKLAKVFGTPVDSNKDCEFAFDGKKLTVKAGKGDHALHVQQMRMAAPRTLKEVDGDFVAEVKASAEHPKGAKPALATRNFVFHSQGLLLWVDDKNYVRFEQARMDPLDGTPRRSTSTTNCSRTANGTGPACGPTANSTRPSRRRSA